MADIIITDKTIACYLLRSDQIKSLAKTIIERWLECTDDCASKAKWVYSEYIKEEVVVNAVPLEKVWSAILESDHVWFFSHFGEESASLYWKLLGMAQRSNIRDRIFFNMAEKGQALQNLHYYCKQAQALMNQLEAQNNLRFFFSEDITQMIRTGKITGLQSEYCHLQEDAQHETGIFHAPYNQLNGAVDYRQVIAALKKLGIRRPLSNEEKTVLDSFAARSPEHKELIAKFGNPDRCPMPLPLAHRSRKVRTQAPWEQLTHFSGTVILLLPSCRKEIRNSIRRFLHFLLQFTHNIARLF